MPQALVEFITEKPTLTESENGVFLLEGIAGQVGVKNRNGRVYKQSTMERIIESVQPLIAEGAFTGELDHPNEGHHGSLEKTAFRFTNLRMEGDLMRFKAELLETPSGEILKGLIKGKVRVGMSTRGAGTLKVEMVDGTRVPVVQEDYQLFGVDAVKVPSSEAGIMRLSESIETNLNLANNIILKENIMDDVLTMAVLKQRHPELVKEIENTVQAVEQAKTAAAEARATSAEAAFEAEKAKGVKLTEAFNQVKAALGVENKADDAAVVAADGLKLQLESLETKVTKMEEAQVAESQRAEKEAKLTEAFEAAVKDADAEEVLRKRINPLQYESVEALTAKITEYKGILEDTGFKKNPLTEKKENGKGVLNEKEDEETTEEYSLTENERQMFKIAGISLKG